MSTRVLFGTIRFKYWNNVNPSWEISPIDFLDHWSIGKCWEIDWEILYNFLNCAFHNFSCWKKNYILMSSYILFLYWSLKFKNTLLWSCARVQTFDSEDEEFWWQILCHWCCLGFKPSATYTTFSVFEALSLWNTLTCNS